MDTIRHKTGYIQKRESSHYCLAAVAASAEVEHARHATDRGKTVVPRSAVFWLVAIHFCRS